MICRSLADDERSDKGQVLWCQAPFSKEWCLSRSAERETTPLGVFLLVAHETCFVHFRLRNTFSFAPTFSKRKGAINTNVNIAFFFGSKRRKEKSLRPSGVSQKRNAVFAGLRPTTRELLKKLDQNFYPLSLRPSSARDR